MFARSIVPSTVSMSNLQAVSCKFLFSREQLVFCHIQLHDGSEKVPAIAHGDSYYSMFRMVNSAESALEFAGKLGSKGHKLAITRAGQRYILWVEESDAQLIPTQEKRSRETLFTFPSANCLILPSGQPYKFSYLTVPDLTHRTSGFEYDQKFYSLLHREIAAEKAIGAVAELARRGLKLALVPLPKSFVICVMEHNASLASS